jgi:hypothetical protein
MCPRPGAGRPFNFLGHISKVFSKDTVFLKLDFFDGFRKK